MKFLVWNSRQDAEDSLAAINVAYGCPHEQGYCMEQWDIIVKSNIGEAYGFFKPEARLGKKADDLMAVLVPGFIEHEEKPVEFYPEEHGEGPQEQVNEHGGH